MTIRACREIFGSSYFDDQQIEPIDLNDARVQDELQSNYNALFEKLFRKSKLSALYGVLNANQQYKYSNPYQTRTVSVPENEPFEDAVFTCAVRDRSTRKIAEYFVSKEYNFSINDVITKVASLYGPTRFVFVEDAAHKTLTVQAIAESPARFMNITQEKLEWNAFYRQNAGKSLNHIFTGYAGDVEGRRRW